MGIGGWPTLDTPVGPVGPLSRAKAHATLLRAVRISHLGSSSFFDGIAAEAAVCRPFTSGATVTPNRDSQVESTAVWDTAALPGGVWTPSVERPSDLHPVYERLGLGGPPTGGLPPRRDAV